MPDSPFICTSTLAAASPSLSTDISDPATLAGKESYHSVLLMSFRVELAAGEVVARPAS